MNRLILLCYTIGFLLFSSTANTAEPLSAKDVLALCFSKEEKQITKCQGYIQGVIDYHNLIRSLGTAPTVDFCVPKNLPIEKISSLVIAYMADNAQHDSFIASPAISLALFEQFPCK